MTSHGFLKQNKGFTLTELLVVITVIGLLAGLIVVSIGGSRVKARDNRRKSDMRLLVVAQEFYMSDNGRYLTCSSIAGDCNPYSFQNYPSGIGERMPSTPEDPRETGTDCDGTVYTYCGLDNTANPETFCYWTKLEESDTAYYTATPHGNFQKTAIPTDFDDCAQAD